MLGGLPHQPFVLYRQRTCKNSTNHLGAGLVESWYDVTLRLVLRPELLWRRVDYGLMNVRA